jgi:hypothetical protein
MQMTVIGICDSHTAGKFTDDIESAGMHAWRLMGNQDIRLQLRKMNNVSRENR